MVDASDGTLQSLGIRLVPWHAFIYASGSDSWLYMEYLGRTGLNLCIISVALELCVSSSAWGVCVGWSRLARNQADRSTSLNFTQLVTGIESSFFVI